MELPGKRKRGKPERSFMDAASKDMVVVEVTTNAEYRTNNGVGKEAVATPDARRRLDDILTPIQPNIIPIVFSLVSTSLYQRVPATNDTGI